MDFAKYGTAKAWKTAMPKANGMNEGIRQNAKKREEKTDNKTGNARKKKGAMQFSSICTASPLAYGVQARAERGKVNVQWPPDGGQRSCQGHPLEHAARDGKQADQEVQDRIPRRVVFRKHALLKTPQSRWRPATHQSLKIQATRLHVHACFSISWMPTQRAHQAGQDCDNHVHEGLGHYTVGRQHRHHQQTGHGYGNGQTERCKPCSSRKCIWRMPCVSKTSRHIPEHTTIWWGLTSHSTKHSPAPHATCRPSFFSFLGFH